MTTSHAHKCPRCGGEMKFGTTSGDFRILKQGDIMGDRANAFYCQDCGFVELYKERSTKEPRRMQARPAESELQQTPKKEPQQPEEEEPTRKPEKRLIR